MIDINGQWIGFYGFEKGYSELNKFTTVPFRAFIQEAIHNFIGRITEEADYGGIDDEIIIKGNFVDHVIEFDKYYTKEHIVDENNNRYSFESENPNIVHYKGRYFLEDKKFKGVWEIAVLKENEDNIFSEENQSGYWEMWREELTL